MAENRDETRRGPWDHKLKPRQTTAEERRSFDEDQRQRRLFDTDPRATPPRRARDAGVVRTVVTFPPAPARPKPLRAAPRVAIEPRERLVCTRCGEPTGLLHLTSKGCRPGVVCEQDCHRSSGWAPFRPGQTGGKYEPPPRPSSTSPGVSSVDPTSGLDRRKSAEREAAIREWEARRPKRQSDPIQAPRRVDPPAPTQQAADPQILADQIKRALDHHQK